VTANGNITQSGAILVNTGGATATFAAGSGHNVTLNNGGNDFNTISVFQGGNYAARNVTVFDANSLNLGNFKIEGDLTILSGGNVTQTGALTIGGQISINGVSSKLLSQSIINDISVFNIPLPKLDTISYSGASISVDEAAKILPPGSIGTLWLQLPFPPEKEPVDKVEDNSKWTSGRLAAAGSTAGPQTGR
jgi:hypothetical protein